MSWESIVRVGVGLVLVVGLVVPVPIVEIRVVVGDLVAVEPVDGDASAGGDWYCRGRRESAVQPTILKPEL